MARSGPVRVTFRSLRLAIWFAQLLKNKLSPDLQGFRRQLVAGWQVHMKRLLDDCVRGPKSTEYAAEPCCVCGKETKDAKRCAGCRLHVYCGIPCQKRHWKGIHSKDCSKEFQTFTKKK